MYQQATGAPLLIGETNSIRSFYIYFWTRQRGTGVEEEEIDLEELIGEIDSP